MKTSSVNCRIGSLEISHYSFNGLKDVNCRIGSLEIESLCCVESRFVNCRIGSLERVLSLIR